MSPPEIAAWLASVRAPLTDAQGLVRQLQCDDVSIRIDQTLLDLDRFDIDVRRWWLGREI